MRRKLSINDVCGFAGASVGGPIGARRNLAKLKAAFRVPRGMRGKACAAIVALAVLLAPNALESPPPMATPARSISFIRTARKA